MKKLKRNAIQSSDTKSSFHPEKALNYNWVVRNATLQNRATMGTKSLQIFFVLRQFLNYFWLFDVSISHTKIEVSVKLRYSILRTLKQLSVRIFWKHQLKYSRSHYNIKEDFFIHTFPCQWKFIEYVLIQDPIK